MAGIRTFPEKNASAPAAVAPRGIVNVSLPALRAAGLLAPEDEQRQLAQQYRKIKRPLIVNAIGRGAPRLPNGHVIMLASAIAGEGKTFTAINLALSMSIEKDVHVLLVDADVAKPHISRLLRVSEAPGLLDVLRDSRLDVEKVILPTDVPNLSLLPAGTHSLEATELLASARMEEVMRAIARHDERRVALFDSPPLLLTTESHAIAQAAGQVVMVVRAGGTPRKCVLAALTHLGKHPAVSLVLNQCNMSAPATYYNYADSRTPPQG
jgi:exopolysaccharide/PEP-CTERM locus tyrosine autokinase